jgi:hypothetical protein
MCADGPPNLPVHNGGHTKEYYDHVRKELDALDAEWNSGQLSEAELFDRIGNIESKIADDLRNCRIFCQATDPSR